MTMTLMDRARAMVWIWTIPPFTPHHIRRVNVQTVTLTNSNQFCHKSKVIGPIKPHLIMINQIIKCTINLNSSEQECSLHRCTCNTRSSQGEDPHTKIEQLIIILKMEEIVKNTHFNTDITIIWNGGVLISPKTRQIRPNLPIIRISHTIICRHSSTQRLVSLRTPKPQVTPSTAWEVAVTTILSAWIRQGKIFKLRWRQPSAPLTFLMRKIDWVATTHIMILWNVIKILWFIRMTINRGNLINN